MSRASWVFALFGSRSFSSLVSRANFFELFETASQSVSRLLSYVASLSWIRGDWSQCCANKQEPKRVGHRSACLRPCWGVCTPHRLSVSTCVRGLTSPLSMVRVPLVPSPAFLCRARTFCQLNRPVRKKAAFLLSFLFLFASKTRLRSSGWSSPSSFHLDLGLALKVGKD